jgi:catechol 2,3-dioxygenase-like lactoylglutathione lyase family enzyme
VQITASAVSLTVEDVAASSAFLTGHLGLRQEMAADGRRPRGPATGCDSAGSALRSTS